MAKSRKQANETKEDEKPTLSQEALQALAAEMESASGEYAKDAKRVARIDSDDRPTLEWEDLPADSAGVRRVKVKVDEVRPVDTQFGARTRLLCTTAGGVEIGVWLPERTYKGLLGERGNEVWLIRAGEGNDARYRVEAFQRATRSRRDGVD